MKSVKSFTGAMPSPIKRVWTWTKVLDFLFLFILFFFKLFIFENLFSPCYYISRHLVRQMSSWQVVPTLSGGF